MLNQSSVPNKTIEVKPGLVNKKSPAKFLKSIENEDVRFHLISEAAYYRALGRGFAGDDHVQDWLIAEVEVDGLPHEHS